MAATQIMKLSLKRHSSAGDEDPAQKLKGVIAKLASRRPVRHCYWANEIDTFNMNNGVEFTRIISVWNSLADIKNFLASREGIQYGNELAALVNGDTISFTTLFENDIHELLVDPAPHATEIITAYFPSEYSEEQQRKFHAGMKELISACERSGDGFKSGLTGWTEELIPKPQNQELGRGYICLNAWTTTEAHVQFRQTKVFADNIHWLRNGENLQAVQVVHVRFTEILSESLE